MNIAGYQFAILDSAFLIHKGFKSSDGFHSHKDVHQNRNRQLYRAFKRRLKMHYPLSRYRCWAVVKCGWNVPPYLEFTLLWPRVLFSKSNLQMYRP